MKTILMILVPFCVRAQTDLGARFAGMAYAGVALQDVWSLQENQAGLCGVKTTTFSTGYSPGFLHTDLKTQAFVLALPYQRYVFGTSFQRYGINAYNQHKFGFAIARQFEKLWVALHGNYHQLYTQKDGSSKNISIEVGLQYHLNENFCLGVHIANPNQHAGTMNKKTNYIPRKIKVGGTFKFSDQLLMATSIEKTAYYPMSIRTGLEYQIGQVIILRGGVSTHPIKQYLGLGIHHNKFKIDLASSLHSTLGYMPQFAFSYEL